MSFDIVTITGSREGFTEGEVFFHLDQLFAHNTPTVVLNSGSAGVDQHVKQWCVLNNIPMLVFAPYFAVDKGAEFNPRHFFMCNKQMVRQSNLVVVFHNEADSKTKDVIARAERAKVRCEIVTPKTKMKETI